MTSRNVHLARSAATMALAFTLLGHPSSAGAQVTAGDTVRLRTRDVIVARGTFVRADSVSVFLRPLDRIDTVRTSFTDFSDFEVLAGHPRAGLRAGLLSAAIGGGVGALAGIGSAIERPGRDASGRAGTVAIGTLVGAVVGGAVGAVASGARTELWRAVDFHEASVPVLATAPREPWRVAAGDTVRLFDAEGHELAHGILRGVDTSAFLLGSMNGADSSSFDRSHVARGEVQRGDRRRGAPALMTGTLVGLGVGAGLVTLAATSDVHEEKGLLVFLGVVYAGITTVAGTAVGGLVALTYTDRWIPFDPATLSLL